MSDRCCAAHPPATGSRRRRLWELGGHAHCPVVGVCLPLDEVRRLALKHLVLRGDEDDYTLHCSVVTAAARRNALSEALHKALDERFRLALQQAARAKCVDSLMHFWRGRAAAGSEMAGALWATLTHPRCNEWLEMRVLGQVHMLQHQVGAAQRVDVNRHRELLAEHQALMHEHAAAQQRVTRWVAERAHEQRTWEAERLQLRATEISLRTQLAQAREQLAQWQRSDLPERAALQQRLADQVARNHALQRELSRPPPASAAARPLPAPLPDKPPEPIDLAAQVVLCVGGRGGSLPQYRQVVEGCGARFLHHDGGDEHKPAQLDPQLAAADLVICQTGCISHDAYWRVKDHCKRHGKRCVFVDTPSRSALERALAAACAKSGA